MAKVIGQMAASEGLEYPESSHGDHWENSASNKEKILPRRIVESD